jgi:carbamoyl-phosphate synthase small subunit
MVGYPQSMTDPSFGGQILIFTYPLIGNYGVGDSSTWESDRIQPSGIIVSTYNETPSHFAQKMTLSEWLIEENIPALEIRDTRYLAKKLRSGGSQLAKIVFPGQDISFTDPNETNLVATVSVDKVSTYGTGKKTIVFIDCGAKNKIIKNFVMRGVRVIRVPWDYDIFSLKEKFHGVFVSNGPGDPKMAGKTVDTIKKAMDRKIPTLGICLGNQLLALAAGGDTYKLKFGHRSQNQPCIEVGTKRCYLTTQNHGYAVGRVPKGFRQWFVNANDQTNEGIIHDSLPFMSVQFHPEATPGPLDTQWIFDYFLKKI